MTDNEKIAKFMGSEYYNHVDMWDVANINGDVIFYVETNELAYHLSWDWIMPVVQKIDLLSPIFEKPKAPYRKNIREQMDKCAPYMKVIALPLATPINEAYKAVINFIDWYNENKKL